MRGLNQAKEMVNTCTSDSNHEPVNMPLPLSGIDRRKNTFIGIEFEVFPIFESIKFQFTSTRKGKIKFWDLFVWACCEVLTTQLTVSGVSLLQ